VSVITLPLPSSPPSSHQPTHKFRIHPAGQTKSGKRLLQVLQKKPQPSSYLCLVPLYPRLTKYCQARCRVLGSSIYAAYMNLQTNVLLAQWCMLQRHHQLSLFWWSQTNRGKGTVNYAFQFANYRHAWNGIALLRFASRELGWMQGKNCHYRKCSPLFAQLFVSTLSLSPTNWRASSTYSMGPFVVVVWVVKMILRQLWLHDNPLMHWPPYAADHPFGGSKLP